MKHFMMRSTVRPDAAEENVRLTVGVFERLRQSSLDGVSHASNRLDDAVIFVQVATVPDPDKNPLHQLGEFHAFTSTIRDRCDVPPVRTRHEVGHYSHASIAAPTLTERTSTLHFHFITRGTLSCRNSRAPKRIRSV